MKLQHQCCTSEQAFKLKELGIMQKQANYCWQKFPAGAAFHFEYPLIYAEKAHEYASAFTVAELGIMLPFTFTSANDKRNHKQYFEGIILNIINDYMEYIPGTGSPNEAVCRANILIKLLIDGKVTALEVNYRLEAAK